MGVILGLIRQKKADRMGGRRQTNWPQVVVVVGPFGVALMIVGVKKGDHKRACL